MPPRRTSEVAIVCRVLVSLEHLERRIDATSALQEYVSLLIRYDESILVETATAVREGCLGHSWFPSPQELASACQQRSGQIEPSSLVGMEGRARAVVPSVSLADAKAVMHDPKLARWRDYAFKHGREDLGRIRSGEASLFFTEQLVARMPSDAELEHGVSALAVLSAVDLSRTIFELRTVSRQLRCVSNFDLDAWISGIMKGLAHDQRGPSFAAMSDALDSILTSEIWVPPPKTVLDAYRSARAKQECLKSALCILQELRKQAEEFVSGRGKQI